MQNRQQLWLPPPLLCLRELHSLLLPRWQSQLYEAL
jgi:hypothetical protein